MDPLGPPRDPPDGSIPSGDRARGLTCRTITLTSTDDGYPMRTIVDLPEGDRDQWDALCSQRGMSRAQSLREALTLCLERERPRHGNVFRPWSDRDLDGLALQRRMRQDWDQR